MRISVIVVLIVFAAVRCTSDEDRQGTGRLDSGMLRIVMRWAGDDFASQHQLAVRDEIARNIAASGKGIVLRTGTGMGWMDIIVQAREDDAHTVIEAIVKKHAKGFVFSIEKQ
jgi:carbon monoxide dehydrogenase subunit G